jgi:penicillin-binding protein 1B
VLLKRILLRTALAAVAALLLYVAWLDHLVTSRFTGNRWQAPTQVYARALGLQAGLPLSTRGLAAELARLGYRESAGARPGTYQREGGRFDIVLRKARLPDRERDVMRLRVVVRDGRIASLQDGGGNPLRIVPLEPLLIGSLLPVRGEDRLIVPLEEVPPLLPATLKAVEDRSFDTHAGVDLKAIARAAWVNLRAGRVEQGGSTLTQQLVKSFFVGERRSFGRKAREALMAMLLEIRFTKPELMSGYLNEVYLGQDGDRAIHGFGLASRFYFGKPLQELELHEIALLVGIVRGPSWYNPRTQPERATGRRDLVLATLAEQDVVPDAEAAAGAKRPLGIVDRVPRGNYAAYLDLVRRQLERDYDADELKLPGLRVFTSLVPAAQEAAERAAREQMPRLDREVKAKGRKLEAAVVVTLPHTGEVIAVVGGRDDDARGFNHALEARRPIGSLVKPVVYLAALETGRYHAASILNDGPVEVRVSGGKDWRPQNFDRQQLGPVPLVRALAESRNLPTVQLGLEVGLSPVARKFRQLGLDRAPAQVPSLLLGAVEMTPLEVAQVYNAFANGGVHRPLGAVQEVVASDGERLYRKPAKPRAAAEKGAVYQLDRMLVDVMTRGTGRAGQAQLPPGLVTAGKSGTSSDLRDSWFAGFSGSHLVVAWVGYDDNAPTGLTGSQGALPLWSSVMRGMGQVPWRAPMPVTLEEVTIDWGTGLLPNPACGNDVIAVVVPRGTPVDQAVECYPGEYDSILERLRGWWDRITDG